MNSVALAEALLSAVKNGRATDSFIEQLHQLSVIQLQRDLEKTGHRKAFWINLYNASTQILLEQYQPDFSDRLQRIRFFSQRKINLAGHLLSLNNMEHGILRHSATWWSMGYFKKPIADRFERSLRVPLDYRIHFALNCGAGSCPAISFYSADKINDELENSMQAFLDQEVTINEQKNLITASALFNWYRGDFGGRQGLIRLFCRHFSIPENKQIKITFRTYNWTVHLRKFKDGI